MPATSKPTDQPTGRIITDEKSLETLFRAHFAALLADAKAKLPGAEIAAPRVVSKAFHQAWNDKGQFRSQEELTVFLKAAIQHGAAREVSRRAGLHRADHAISGSTDTGETHTTTHHDVVEMNVDEAWDRLQHTLHGGAPEAYRQRASTARHEAAEHMAALGTQRNWKPIIAIVVVALVAIAGLVWTLDRQGADIGVARALADSDARRYETSYNQFVRVTLDDGTVVDLGPESRLTVPTQYNIELRAVGLEGTANFTVAQALETPFQVRIGELAITATGTEFAVRRYASDTMTIVKAREGSVEVRIGNERRQLSNGMGVGVTNTGTMVVPTPDQLNETVNWVDGSVSIAGRTLRDVLPELRRWFGLDIKVPDTTLLNREVFLSAPVGAQRSALTSIEQSGRMKWTYIGENMTFVDAPATTVPTRGRR
jgi:ferric-dicitrate binding protein FerR (iron transport regulator)